MGKQYEPDSLEPLLDDIVEKHPELDIEKVVYSLRAKIEPLFSQMKEQFKMEHVYKRGVSNIFGHICKFVNLMHIVANVTGTYGIQCFKRMEKGI